MDRSKVFILQCEKAIDLQKLRGGGNWLNGDFYSDNVLKHPTVAGDFGVCQDGEDEPYSIYNPVWLPRQDQLQDMLEECNNLFFWDLCRKPEGWLCLGRDIGEERIYPYDSLDGIKEHHYSKTAEQALLKMLMKVEFNKIWGGKDWMVLNE